MNDARLDFDRYDRIRPIRWTGDALELLDQRKLPFVVEYVACTDSAGVAEAIHALTVRGAPAIGIAAAWGVVLAAREVQADSGADVTRAFCPTCGTGIHSRNSKMPGLIFLRASTLDDPNLFAPQMIVWAARAPAWDPVNPGVPAFAERPTAM